MESSTPPDSIAGFEVAVGEGKRRGTEKASRNKGKKRVLVIACFKIPLNKYVEWIILEGKHLRNHFWLWP